MPSPDILLTPTNPISSSWKVEGLTCEGRKLVALMLPSMTISNQLEMAELREWASEYGLIIETDWSCAGKAMAL